MTKSKSNDEIALAIARISAEVKQLRVNSLSRGSIVNDGAITAYAPDANNPAEPGNPGLIVGTQYDGSITAAPVNGALPPRPAAPVVEPELHSARVNWSGTYLGADGAEDLMIVAPMDFSRVEVHAGFSADFSAATTQTLVGTIETPRGGDLLVPLAGDQTRWIKLVVRSLPGRRGAASPGVEVTPSQTAVGELSEEDLARIAAAEAAAAEATATAQQAIADAADAAAIADGKVRAEFVPEPPTGLGPSDIGDMWFDTNDGNKMYRWDGDSWEVAQDTGIAAALVEAERARIDAIEAPWLNSNSTFNNWPGGAPVGWSVDSGVPVKETMFIRSGTKAVRFATATAPTAMTLLETTAMDPVPLGIEYMAVEVDFLLVSGGLGGAGIALDWDGLTPARAVLSLANEVTSPVLNKWYRVSTVMRRPTGATGTQTGWTARLLANSSIIGSMSAKDIIFDRVGFRPASGSEIQAATTASSVTILTATVNTKVTTFYQPTVPVSLAVGDLWVDTDDNNHLYRAAIAGADAVTAGEWVSARDGSIETAQQSADTAQASANSKNSVTYSTSAPGTAPNAVGDIWFRKDATGNIIAQYEGSGGTTWAERQLSHQTIASIDMGKASVGELRGQFIAADALNGKTITGALIRTAAAGKRLELTTTGLIQLDSAGNVILSIGDTNKFTGEIDATSMIIRDSMQLFGRNNLFAVGSKVTLKSSTSAPTQAPTLSWEYEQGPSPSIAGWFVTGVHTTAAGAGLSTTELFLDEAQFRTPGGRWLFPYIGNPADKRSGFKPYTYTRIRNSANTADRAVMIGEDKTRIGANGYPETWVRVYNDSTMVAGGTVAPVLTHEFKFADFSFFKNYRVVRLINPLNQSPNSFCIIETDQPAGGGSRNVKYHLYTLTSESTLTLGLTRDLGPALGPDDDLSGGVYGISTLLGLDGPARTVLVIQTTMGNYVYNETTSAFEPESAWPVGSNPQNRTWAQGSVSANTVDDLYSYNWGIGSDVRSIKYAKNHKTTPSTIWASFAWRGEASKAFRTPMSAQSAIVHRNMARLRVSVPALPAPVAGVGAARDATKDVYGWVYYLGTGATTPPRVSMFEQPTQPVMVANTALTDTSIALTTYPTLTGNNPVAATTFPAASPATIESDNGTLTITGDGDITARSVNGVTSIGDTGWITAILGNSWTSSGGRTIRYKRLNGVIHIQGLGATGASGTVVFVLPVNFRPTQTVEPYNDSARNLIIDTAGQVIMYRVNPTVPFDTSFAI